MPTRREFLAGALSAGACLAANQPAPDRLGVAAYSFHLRLADARSKATADLSDPFVFLDHCRQLGAGGIQLSLGQRDHDEMARLRDRAKEAGMFLEGQVRIPKDQADLPRFEAEVQTARAAGVSLLRSVMLPGRRYETFRSLAEFEKWKEAAFQQLSLAAPILARHDMRLAVENHKDLRADEFVQLLKRLKSEHIGVCLDTGNNLALLQDIDEVVETLLPWTFGVHLKDMAVEEHDEGFLLSEVVLGTGIFDLKALVGRIRDKRPGIRFNLEMITRDPLKVPCLSDGYWATMNAVPARDLARTLALVKKRSRRLPRVSGLPRDEQIALEQENVRACLGYAKKELGL